MEIPDIFGLLSYHISGDEAIFHLARERYSRAGLGVEVHPGSAAHLRELFAYLPQGRMSSVHLPYDAALYDDHTDYIHSIVRAGGDRISTYVLHDCSEYAHDFRQGVELIKKLSSMLEGKSRARVCLEYAVGLPFELFLEIIDEIKDLPNIGVCIDIGHVGIGAVKKEYALKFPGMDVCAIKSSAELTGEVYREVEAAVTVGRDKALAYIEELCRLGAYTHFHLHDGHPLSTFSPYKVCDHLSFFWEIPTCVPAAGSINGIYGISGLEDVLRIVTRNLVQTMCSFTLEIHPQAGKSAIADEYMHYFSSWTDLTNAEKMNYWIDLVIQNCLILRNIWKKL